MFVALDLDIRRRVLEKARGDAEKIASLRSRVVNECARIHAELVDLGLRGIVEDSGYKGRHIWLFFERPLRATLAHRLGRLLLARLAPTDEHISLEVFPKQARLDRNQVGNLIKLPLGIHKVSGRRAMLLEPDGRVGKSPWVILRNAAILSLDRVDEVLRRLSKSKTEESPVAPLGDSELELDPKPRTPEQPFTRAHFKTIAPLETLVSRCCVLRTLVHRAVEDRHLEHDERVVLAHSIGHLAAGPRAVNYLLDQCPALGPEHRLKRPHTGHPISCPRIRQRLPNLTSNQDCHCMFPDRPDHYPTPLLHVDGRQLVESDDSDASAEEAATIEVANAYRQLLSDQARLRSELDTLRLALVDELASRPSRALVSPSGTWQLLSEDVGAVLHFEPNGSERSQLGAQQGGD